VGGALCNLAISAWSIVKIGQLAPSTKGVQGNLAGLDTRVTPRYRGYCTHFKMNLNRDPNNRGVVFHPFSPGRAILTFLPWFDTQKGGLGVCVKTAH
jgi:hypothetical protein